MRRPGLAGLRAAREIARLSHLTSLDKVLVLILVPLWAVCFTLSVLAQARGEAYAVLGLSVEDADSYPAVSGQFSHIINPLDPLAEAGLQAGDRLVRLGDADLRGVSTLGFTALSLEAEDQTVPLVFERNEQRLDTSLRLAPMSSLRPMMAVSIAFAASAMFLLLRGRPTPMVRAYFYFAMCQAIAPGSTAGSRPEFYAWFGMFVVTQCLYFPLMIRFAFLFPDDRVPESRWHRIWPWFIGVPFGLSTFLLWSSQMRIAELSFTVIAALGFVATLAVASHKYRGADRVAHRQMKWVVIGAYCAFLPIVIAGVLNALDPRFSFLWFPSLGALTLLPIFFVVSVLRFNLFDIDRILSATASYNILAVLLGAGALVVVPRLAEAVSGFVGMDPGTTQVVLSLALAAVLIPAHRRLRPQIDRVFFKERYALDHGIAELLPTLSSCSDARELTERTGAGLYSLLRPEACVVYAGVEQSYATVFAEGRAVVPPAFEADSPLIAALRGRRAPLSLSGAGRRPDEARLGPFDRAALETLQAEVVVPVQQGDALAGFLCLGPKRSGDVYTSTDLSLLAAVAETVSHQLQRFDQDAVIREGRELQASLRRYVPGAIAEQISNGAELSSGEREVTVLFVDIRGYTGFSENRRAEDVFSAVNRYTETVSQIVQKHAGSVVEFNGDGMMAVFGAPKELAHKERAAVEAGTEIIEAVASLPVEDAAGASTKLSVGVGIATGEAFVGNIQAVDRMIWSAIGNTTNLAARLQSLTRDLDAALVIDHATWERAQPAAAGFEKHSEVAIRGRRETQDVYALSMRSDS